jgi:hypothetical protein
MLLVVVVVFDEIGAALVQPPKSSSAATVGVGLGGAPQPDPMSLAVNVSGTFIIEAADGVAAAGAGAGSGTGSGVLHAFPPHGSMFAGSTLADGALAGDVCLGGAEGCITGLERLNAEFISCCGDGALGCGGGEETAAGAGGGEERPNRSFDKEEDGGFGFVGDAKPPKPKSCPLEEIEVVRD